MVPQSRWPSLARDLAIHRVPGSPIDLGDIKGVYGVEEAELVALVKLPAFAAMVRAEMRNVEAAGSKAVAQYRASTLAAALSEKLYRDATEGEMKTADELKFLELQMKAAGYMDSGERGSPQVSITNVNAYAPPVPRLANPKLRHLEA